MCTGLELLLGAVSGAGAIAGAAGRSSDAALQAEVARGNKRISETTAQTQEVLAELPAIDARLQETRIREQVRQTIGSETADYAAANIDPSSGAPLILAGVTAAQGEVDVGLVRAQGALGRAQGRAEAASSYAAAASSGFQVAAAETEKSNALVSGIFGAGTAFLSPLGRIGGFGGLGGGAATVRPAAASAYGINSSPNPYVLR